MRTYVIDRFDSSLDGLVISERPIPQPGRGEVLVRVRATSLNFRDLIILGGHYQPTVPIGRVPLSDAAGEIEAIGEGVSRFAVGDRIVNAFFPNWFGGPLREIPEQWVVQHDGWLTEYRVVNAECLVHMPAHLSFEEAATLPCAAVTAWSALHGVRPGDVVLTQGEGGVSLFAIQLARVFGARVIATTANSDHASRLLALGATDIIDTTATPEWNVVARELTSGRGVDRVVEVGGPSTLSRSIAATRPGGDISIIGILGGAQGGIDFMTMFASRVGFRTITTGNRDDLADLVRAVEQHQLRPVVDSIYDFADARSAVAYYAARKLFGKVVVKH